MDLGSAVLVLMLVMYLGVDKASRRQLMRVALELFYLPSRVESYCLLPVEQRRAQPFKHCPRCSQLIRSSDCICNACKHEISLGA
ncbi:hypothetical protein [Agaribacterium haliotis]|uniref:hypothetical protein n=1 Tax=Agaribacterium haliotis TaxID=2013869 RepID=UPI000BB5935C|nr:hypothetical protein [Agaribacterium haliotis]